MKSTEAIDDQITVKETGRVLAKCYGNNKLASTLSGLINKGLGIEPEEPEESEDVESSPSKGMTAEDAIDHIEETPLEDLEGFVTAGEDRVTVNRAWEEKNAE